MKNNCIYKKTLLLIQDEVVFTNSDVMKLCPYCGREYSDDAKYCIVDAGNLIEYDVDAQNCKKEMQVCGKYELKNSSEKEYGEECGHVIIGKTEL